jgi:hypothetical protein
LNIWRAWKDYSGLPALRPSGHQQKALMLKIAPGNFFEPNDEQNLQAK